MNGTPFTFPVLHNAVGIMTPFLLAAVGGLFTELSGMLNIALEGLMLTGAFFSVLFVSVTGSLLAGILMGMAAAVLLSWLYGVISLRLGANIFITGLATNIFAAGLTVVIAYKLFDNKGIVRFDNIPHLPSLSLPFLERIPVLGDVLAGHNMFVYLSWLFVIAAAVVIYKTPFGLRLRGTGLNSEAVKSLGITPYRYRMAGILVSGATCGLAGAMLSLRLGAFIPDMTSGRGWIALVVIYLGNKNPAGIVIASFVFGLAESISIYAQGVMNIPADFILAFPYIITCAAMVLYSIYRYYRKRRSGTI